MGAAKEQMMREMSLRARAEEEALEMYLLLRGDPESPLVISPISWLQSMLDDLKERGPHEHDPDPLAWWEMLSEVEQFQKQAARLLSRIEDQADD